METVPHDSDLWALVKAPSLIIVLALAGSPLLMHYYPAAAAAAAVAAAVLAALQLPCVLQRTGPRAPKACWCL
jgi:hypothetical protein